MVKKEITKQRKSTHKEFLVKIDIGQQTMYPSTFYLLHWLVGLLVIYPLTPLGDKYVWNCWNVGESQCGSCTA